MNDPRPGRESPGPGEYTTRPARDSDKPWLEKLRRSAYADLYRATWGGWDEERHRRQFADSWQRGGIEMVEIDGRAVGMIQLGETDDHVEVREIQVLPEAQGTGIGTRLLMDVIERTRRRGKDVVLSTGLRNLGAAKLFERLGFEEAGRSETHVHYRYSTGRS